MAFTTHTLVHKHHCEAFGLRGSGHLRCSNDAVLEVDLSIAIRSAVENFRSAKYVACGRLLCSYLKETFAKLKLAPRCPRPSHESCSSMFSFDAEGGRWLTTRGLTTWLMPLLTAAGNTLSNPMSPA